MAKHGKKYRDTLKLAPQAPVGLEEAIAFVQAHPGAKFDETIEIAMRLGVDSKKSDQTVRGTVSLPHGTGKTARVIVFAAGAQADALEVYLEHADALVVPVLPSALDIDATVPFLNTLARHPRIRGGALRVGLVGNRLRPWTNASQQAMDLLRQWPYPLVAELRDSQAYVMLVGFGKSLYDYNSALVRDHQADWQPLLRWVRKA